MVLFISVFLVLFCDNDVLAALVCDRISLLSIGFSMIGMIPLLPAPAFYIPCIRRLQPVSRLKAYRDFTDLDGRGEEKEPASG